MEDFICPICGSTRHQLLHETRGGLASFDRHRSKFFICECGLVFQLPRPSAKELVEGFYAVEYWRTGRDIPKQSLFPQGRSYTNRAQTIIEVIGYTGGELFIDIGCGFGHLTGTLGRQFPDSRVIGIEPDRNIAEHLRRHNSLSNVRIECGSIEAFPDVPPAKAIFLLTVFEHLFDPVAALAVLRSHLAEDGFLIIEVPDVMEPGRWGLDFFFRGQHLWYYSEATLTAMLEENGFKVIKSFRGGVFKNATAGALCIIATKADSYSRAFLSSHDSIVRRIAEVRSSTRIKGPLRAIYRRHVRKRVYRLQRYLQSIQYCAQVLMILAGSRS